MKETLTGPVAVAAYVGAIVGIVGVILGYWAGERQYTLEHDKWMVDVIIKLSATPEAKGHLKYIVDAGLLDERDRGTLCNAFKSDGTSCPKK